jgi:hypothetical protein
VDESWINDTVRLIPRMKDWVATHSPGLDVALTEYSWGADGHINGATAQADILGIFGREGLDIATRWGTPDMDTPTFKAMQMYRNYDGQRSTFGDISVRASVPDPDELSAFAALRASDRALTVIVINKVPSSAPVTLGLSGFSPAPAAEVWRLTSSNSIQHLPDVPVSGHALSANLPAQSITLFVIPNRPGPVRRRIPSPGEEGDGLADRERPDVRRGDSGDAAPPGADRPDARRLTSAPLSPPSVSAAAVDGEETRGGDEASPHVTHPPLGAWPSRSSGPVPLPGLVETEPACSTDDDDDPESCRPAEDSRRAP